MTSPRIGYTGLVGGLQQVHARQLVRTPLESAAGAGRWLTPLCHALDRLGVRVGPDGPVAGDLPESERDLLDSPEFGGGSLRGLMGALAELAELGRCHRAGVELESLEGAPAPGGLRGRLEAALEAE